MEKLAEALRTATEMERRGREVYLEAADAIADRVVKSVLLELAHDEEEHERIIDRFYSALQNHQGWPAPEGEDRPLDLPDRVTEMLEETSVALSHSDTYTEIYETALDLEMQSREFYLAQSNVADDRRLIEFFRFLARVESAHAKALERLAGGAKGR